MKNIKEDYLIKSAIFLLPGVFLQFIEEFFETFAYIPPFGGVAVVGNPLWSIYLILAAIIVLIVLIKENYVEKFSELIERLIGGLFGRY